MTKHPAMNALFITALSAFYSFLFIFISDHMEFQSIVHPKGTLQIPVINAFTGFIMGGNMKYVGYAIIVLAAAILVITIFRGKKYDEYQQSIQAKCALAIGILTIFMVPLLLLFILTDPNYSIEFIFLFIIIHWFCVLITDLIYVVKYSR
ncbi:MAG: hypothetical protein PHY90_03145 [Desulfitobacteriaceae bacterium]|nr:hypothetical protein [Desulfitobacteriaceae bacterium]